MMTEIDMNKYIDERGFLTEDGKKIFEARFGKEVDALLSISTNENQARIIESILKWMIGNKTSDKVLEFAKVKNV